MMPLVFVYLFILFICFLFYFIFLPLCYHDVNEPQKRIPEEIHVYIPLYIYSHSYGKENDNILGICECERIISQCWKG